MTQNTNPGEMLLPVALEKVLAYQDVRINQVGISETELEKVQKGEYVGEIVYEKIDDTVNEDDINYADDDDDENDAPADKPTKKDTKTKGKKKKKKKKSRSQKKELNGVKLPPAQNEPTVDIEYIPEQLEVHHLGYAYHDFARVFDAFKITELEKPRTDVKEESGAVLDRNAIARKLEEIPLKARGIANLESQDDDDVAVEEPTNKLSKKKLKKLNRLSVAELKQLVTRPDVVEMHDVTSRDPKLLVHLKATRNTVTVPRHWCFKRKYLQGKRGIEKAPFDLPDFIKSTGITEMRMALQEKEDQKTLKSKMRERVRPKMGKIDIDYQKLHDAFFKWQTKPKMTIHGDLYYEGKEFETKLKEKKPGNLTEDLRTALGMPIGANSEKYPPPWLIAMQRYGLPPSYPNLKIPGLNAPIPEGCSFGYHPGGWGKPPVDEKGKPLYGDVFGISVEELQAPVVEEEVDNALWGELESESEEEESESEEEDEEPDTTGLVTPGETGLVTPSGVTSVPVGMETPDMIELRKKRIEDAMDQGGDTPALYQVLPEKKTGGGAGGMMGSAHVYDIAAATTGRRFGDRPASEGVEVALNPEELDLDTTAMQAKYDQTIREQQSQLEKEDLSDMVAEHAAKQQKKRKKQQQQQQSESNKSAKKHKEFKF